jgi:superfamily II DNA or RNA helicase
MIFIASNAVNAKIGKPSKEVILELNRVLSYRVAGAEHMPGFGSNGWSGRSSYLSMRGGDANFPAGFVSHVAAALRLVGIPYQLVSSPLPVPLGPERPKVSKFGYTERYAYQPETVDKLIRYGKMIAQVATGGGKSLICRMAYKRIDRNTLFLTTRGILMHQMRDAMVSEMGEEVAILGDGTWGIEYDKPDGTKGRRLSKFCVGMVQTLAQRLEKTTVEEELQALKQRRTTATAKMVAEMKASLVKEGCLPHLVGARINEALLAVLSRRSSPKIDLGVIELKVAKQERLRLGTIKFLERFELVIAEEAHEVSGAGFYAVMAACKNAHYRLALTATPFMKDDEEANMQLLASCGPIGTKISEQLLIDRGILAKPYFKFLKLDPLRKPKALYRSTPWQRAYTVGIVNNEYRNKLMCAEILRGMAYGLNALMLVNHKAHGDVLKTMLIGAGARVEFIDGSSNQKVRQDCLNRLGAGELDVLIGSTIMDVGVDVPSIGMIVLAGGGKAEVSLRQRIGRGLREKKNGGPNVALVVDVSDDGNNHLKGHAIERRKVILGTPGFAENVVTDFNFAELGMKRKTT